MGLVEYHVEQITKAPQLVLGEKRQAIQGIIEEYMYIFTGIMELKRVTIKLHVEPNVPGAMQKLKRRSLLLKDKFNKILERWHEMDVINQKDEGNEPADWFSNMYGPHSPGWGV